MFISVNIKFGLAFYFFLKLILETEFLIIIMIMITTITNNKITSIKKNIQSLLTYISYYYQYQISSISPFDNNNDLPILSIVIFP